MRINDSTEAGSVYGGRFTGEVSLAMLGPAAGPTDPDIARVTFRDGAATFWHSHPGGQRLYLLEGRGRVGTREDGEVELAPGTYVDAPADEYHYHGAVAGATCTFLAITWGTTAWSDEAPAPSP